MDHSFKYRVHSANTNPHQVRAVVAGVPMQAIVERLEVVLVPEHHGHGTVMFKFIGPEVDHAKKKFTINSEHSIRV